MSSEVVSLKQGSDLIQDLKDYVECQICLTVPDDPPIFQCLNGHLLCQICHQKLDKCPTCRSKLSSVRCLLAEKLLDKIPSPCYFQIYGCEVILPRQDLPGHSKVCGYREVVCPYPLCNLLISLVILAEHVEQIHSLTCPGSTPNHLEENFNARMGITILAEDNVDFSALVYHLQFNGVHFFVEVSRIKNSAQFRSQWYVWIFGAATSDACNDFVCYLKICNDDSEEMIVKIGPVISLDIARDQVLRSDSVLMFTDSSAKRFIKNKTMILGFGLRKVAKVNNNIGNPLFTTLTWK